MNKYGLLNNGLFKTHMGDYFKITNNVISVDDYESMNAYEYILLEANYNSKDYKSIFASPSTPVSYSNWSPNSQKNYITLRERLLRLDYTNEQINNIKLKIAVEV